MKFEKTLKYALYDLGYINVPVACQTAVSPDSQFPVTIYLGHANRGLHSTGNRTANQNGTPRITGGPTLAAWLQEHFAPEDEVEFEILSPNVIICHLPSAYSQNSSEMAAQLDDPIPHGPEEGQHALSPVEDYLRQRDPLQRYSSWDYCFSYFQSFKNKQDVAAPQNLEKSCLHIGFYLASWGMFRGRSFLLQKSVKFYEPLICFIADQSPHLWNIDANNYDNKEVREDLIKLYKGIESKTAGLEGNRALVIVTKIMLGIFGNIPAYDRYFTETFRDLYGKGNGGSKSAFRAVDHKSLECLWKFYTTHSAKIDQLAKGTQAFSWNGSVTGPDYTRAKIIDMYGFQVGLSR